MSRPELMQLKVTAQEARLLISAAFVGLKGYRPVPGDATVRERLLDRLIELMEQVLEDCSKTKAAGETWNATEPAGPAARAGLEKSGVGGLG